MTTYEEYYEAQNELEKKYGARSIVLMQVGSFYEMYGVDTEEIKIGHVDSISKILSMQIAYKNGRDKPHNMKNPQMVGFPDYALGNHLEKILRANYTVAIYNQHDSENGEKKKSRKVVNIYSPSTFIDEEINESNALLIIGSGEYKCAINKTMITYAHLVVFDLSHGSVTLSSIYNTRDDDKKVDTELYRLIHTFNPSEILYSGKILDVEKRYEIKNKKIYHKPLNKIYQEPAYQNEFLNKIYKCNSITSPIEFLGLERHTDIIPYFIQGLQYAYEHDPLILQKINIPQFLNTSKRLTLNNDSLYQLHLIDSSEYSGDNKFTSVFNTINHTKTAMGKRLLKHRLLMPTTSKKILNNRYDKIAALMVDYKKYEELLKGITDIDRIYRKMASKKLHPYEMANIKDSLIGIFNVLTRGQTIFNIEQQIIDDVSNLLKEYEATFDHDSLKNGKLGSTKRSYFNSGISENVDLIGNTIKTNLALLDNIAEILSNNIDKNKTCIGIDFNNNDGYHLKTTVLRFKKLSDKLTIKLESGQVIKYDELSTKILTNTVKITCPYTDNLSNNIIKAESELNNVVNQEYLRVLEKWSDKYAELFSQVSNLIADIDFTMNGAKVATMYGYNKPIITKPNNKSGTKYSYIIAEELRHPIIERIVTKTEYISNNVTIGIDNCGLIIYGVNMSGKSSLLRSVGTAIVMAQAGMYVSAKKFQYYPFTKILSKITVQDNPFKGQSLFMVEMEEVNNMLRRGDERTLILSDELCSSTETSSAHAIVACTLKKLAEKNVNFIFATHLHELQKIPEIKNNAAIKIVHFKVTIKDSQMIFDRILQDGGIPDTYGLEIAQAIGLPTDFIKDAFLIRDYLKQNNTEIVSTKKSRYNKDIYMDHCTFCGTNKSLETHHIREQHKSNSVGLITTDECIIQQDQHFNLMVVCRDCHMKIHQNELKVEEKKLKIKL